MTKPFQSNTVYVAIFICLAILGSTAYGQTTQKNPFSKRNINELRQTVKDLFDVWYRKQDEKSFWIFVAKDNIYKRLKRDEWQSQLFSGAFDGKPNLATLKISAVYQEKTLKEENVDCLNPVKKDGFCIFYISRATPLWEKMFPTPTQKELKKTEGLEYLIPNDLLPSCDFLTVLYEIRGSGYTNEGLNTLWIREGGWKLFSLRGFD